MIRMLKLAASCFVTGFVIPTLAFATIEEQAVNTNPAAYLFQLAYSDVEEAVGFALADKGAGDKVSASITGRKEGPVFSHNKPLSVEIRGLKFDKNAGRWNASLMFVSENAIVSAMPVSGRFEEMVELPVLKRQMRSGETINDKDIQIRDFPVSSTRSDAITDLASLIGKSPLRTISMNRPIREQEIARPTIVKKNALVQMNYNSGAMQISDAGQAMEDGSQGSVISVKNVASKKTIRAVVVSADRVEVMPQAQSSQLSIRDAYETN